MGRLRPRRSDHPAPQDLRQARETSASKPTAKFGRDIPTFHGKVTSVQVRVLPRVPVSYTHLGAKVWGLLAAQFCGSLFILVGGIAITRRLLPSVRPNPFRCKLASLRKIVSFSLPLYAGYVMTSLQDQLEKLYLARMTGIVPVGWYSVASQGASKIRRGPDMLLGPVLAAASELDASKEREKLEELHFRAHKYLAVSAVPLAVFAVVTAKALVSLWVGSNLEVVAFTFAVLVVGNLFPQIGSPTYFIMVGRGVLRPAVYSALLATILNVVLSYVFIKRWGFAGAAFGTAIPMIISTVYFFHAYKSCFETSLYRTLLRAYFKPLLCSAAAACMVCAIGLLKLRMWQGLVVDMIVFGAIYFIAVSYTHLDDAHRLHDPASG